ncbi:MAG: SDR family NAD(P)-dependent oxidoreductase [Deltaproteobacteria bacterium]|nr:SDR family NAD(P)-dependent oxidoreductase [Deltaproteobacteria bacterium]
MEPGKTVLITGATTGLGLAIARALTKTDYRVYLTARQSSLPRFDMHQVSESEHVRIRALDVTSAEQRTRIVAEAERDWGGIDILINNAGIAYRAVVEHVTEEERIAQMDVNFRSPMELIRLVLPGMREKLAGRIITMSSVGGMMAMPTMAAYSASKFALEGAHESLWYEVRPWGIKVSLVQPGFIDSDGFQRVRHTPKSDRSKHELAEPYHEHYVNMGPFIERLMKSSRATPDSVARVVLKTMRRRHPPLRVPATLDALGFSILRRILPRNSYHWLLYKMLPKVDTWGPSPKRVSSLPPATKRDGSDER